MKTRIKIIWMITTMLLLAACTSSNSPSTADAGSIAISPSSTLVSTPTPIVTPAPTSTPLPTATPTTEPTITPTPIPLLEFEKNMSLQDLVEIFNRDGDYEMLVNLLDSLTSYYRELPVQLSKIYALMGDAYSHQGDLEHAAVAYDKALQKFHDFKQVHDELCRVYGLLDDPEKALDNCELASLANPDYWTYYNRGKVYAMLGFWKNSIQDFEMVSKLLESSTGENERKLVEQVNDWIGVLQQGENPITAEVLAEERAQAMDQAMPTQTIEEQAAPSGIDLQAAAAGFGFTVFKASEMKDPFQDNGLPFVEASLAFGECSSTLALQDDEVMVQKVMMVMKGCNQMEEYAMGIRLIDEFFPGKEDKAKALIWLFKEANLVIEENEAKSKIATVRNCNLNAINDFTTQSTQLLFSCH